MPYFIKLIIEYRTDIVSAIGYDIVFYKKNLKQVY